MSHTQVFCKQNSLNAKDELGSCLLSALIWAALDLCLTSVVLSMCYVNHPSTQHCVLNKTVKKDGYSQNQISTLILLLALFVSPVTIEGIQDDQLALIMSKHMKQISPGLSSTPFNEARHPLRNVD